MINTILICTMALDIGGAETHILELSLDLKSRGYRVIVASNGGVYVPLLEEAGITHYAIPMDRREIPAMLKSYFMLKKVIKKEKPDIVHAHARIPGFICGLLRKTIRFPFITTAHGVFDVSGSLRYLTNWGQKTIAVSEDIKEYLIKNYGMPEADIYTTINGIDTAKFSPENTSTCLCGEFGIDTDAPVICNVSRLDTAAAMVSRQLIEIAPELEKKLPGVRVIIVGGGEDYEELCEKANAVNEATGKRTVIMTGWRTDISNIAALCDVFVGVSRAALEAMSMEKPCILSGSQGFMGLLTPENWQEAATTNFCCRGHVMSTQELLINEIVSFFNNTDTAERTRLGAFTRSQVEKDYSVRRMTDDCLLAYDHVRKKKYNVLMSGYYGYGNAGDEAILQSIRESIESVGGDVSVTVLSKNPENTEARYGCEAVRRFNAIAVVRAISRCDVLVSGGGSLLQDYTSTRSLIYYLVIMQAARFLGKKVMVYANGIGPVRKKANRARVKKAVERANLVTLRDPSSYEELKNMGCKRDDVIVTADPVFLLPREFKSDPAPILEAAGIPPQTPYAVVSVRDWPEAGDFSNEVAVLCKYTAEKYGVAIVLLAMQPTRDSHISNQVANFIGGGAYVLDGSYSTSELTGIFGGAEFALAMRFHALIFAAKMNVPFAAIIYDPKVEAYTKLLAMPSAGSVSGFSAAEAQSAIDQIAVKREKLSEILEEKSSELEALAKRDAELLFGLLQE